MRFNDIQRAVERYEKAWSYYKTHEFNNFDIIEYCLKPLGNAYSMLGDYHSAENIIKSYLLEAGHRGDREQQVAALINLSIVYQNTGRYDEAIRVLERALQYDEYTVEKLGYIYANLARAYLQQEKFDLAETSAKGALSFFMNRADSSPDEFASIYTVLSNINLHRKDTTSALAFLNTAYKLVHHREAISTRKRAKIKTQYAHLLAATDLLDSAFQMYQNALAELVPDFRGVLPADDQLYAENTLKEIFDGLAGIYVERRLLKQAIACYEKSFTVEEYLSETLNYHEAKHLHQNENRNRAEKVIELWYARYMKEKDSEYLQNAFWIAERTKSIALKDELYDRNAWKASGRDSLFSRKMLLSQKRARLEHDLILEKQKGAGADMSTLQRLLDEKNEITLQIKNLQQRMEPDLSKKEQLDVELLQSTLEKDGVTLIEYFLGANALYTFILDGKNIRIKKNDHIDSLRQTIIQFSQLFSNQVKITAAPELFIERAVSLYHALIPEEVETDLLIIPDGMLNFIPFESLLSAGPSSGDFENWPWLFKKYPVFYQYSAALYQTQAVERKFDNKGVLGFFPYIEPSDRYLKYSLAEKNAIKKQFKGNFFTDKHATKSNFMKNVENYPVVHLSTHAYGGNIDNPPAIYFFDGPLYLPEIYGLDLHTKLLVLGACETGIGKLYKGEGPLSLAGGFAFAGVRNMMLSLWKVNDFSTSKLMSYFYKKYKKRSQAYLAVHQAKLDYLSAEDISNESKSPYFWASFVFYGGSDSQP